MERRKVGEAEGVDEMVRSSCNGGEFKESKGADESKKKTSLKGRKKT